MPVRTVLVLFADGSEELEAVTVVNILRRAGVSVTLAGLNAGAPSRRADPLFVVVVADLPARDRLQRVLREVFSA